MLDINLDDFTIGELEEIEEIGGVPFSSIGEGNLPIKAIKALVFVVKRRDDPAFTIEDAAKVKVTEFTVTAETGPTDAAS